MSDKPSLDPATQANVDEWLHRSYDEATNAEIRRRLLEDPVEITDSLYKKLSFGTGGLRGLMGAAPTA